MANYKRKKPRRQVKCTLCIDSISGNSRLAKLRVKQINDLLRPIKASYLQILAPSGR